MRFKELLLTAAALVALGCSKESKEDSQTKTVSSEIEGTYNGTISFSVAGSEAGSSDTQTIITGTGDETVTVTLKGDPDATGMAIKGDIPVENVKVTRTSDTEYSLAETQLNANVGGVNYTGTLTGTVSGKSAHLTFVLRPGAMPMDVTGIFTGERE